jgi:dihydrofolate reductase
MRKLILSMHTSLDGFVTGPNEDMSWMQPDNDEQWDDLFDMLSNVDLFLLGSGMWEEYKNYWKKALSESGFSTNEVRYAKLAKKTKHIVFSSTLKNADWENTKIESSNINQALGRIKAEPGKNIQIVGGAKFAASMIDSGLVDEYRIIVNPIIVGKGKSFFHHLSSRHNLKRTNVKTLNNGVVILTYMQLDSENADKVNPRKRREQNNS